MWFKQAQFFELTQPIAYDADKLGEKLASLAFTPCVSSLPSSHGWICPVEDSENGPLVHAASGYMIICLQYEEKILPASVIRQATVDKIKALEAAGSRKVGQKEKASLKEHIMFTLLPRAFTRLTRIYAYIDTKNQRIILNTVNAKRTEQFIEIFKKCVTDAFNAPQLKKLAPIMTNWISENRDPPKFSAEKTCLLQDPQQQTHIIRCQQQDLSASSIQEFIKEGYEVKKIGLAWQDRMYFVLSENFSLSNIQFQDEILAQAKDIQGEDKQQRFDADFFIMTETFGHLLNDLLPLFIEPETTITAPNSFSLYDSARVN
ncbi:MAG: recombination-associated protein RdgC [Gammaproteobacteria bacterium]